MVVCNFSPVHRQGYRVGAPFGGTWTPVFNTDDTRYGGQGLGDLQPLKTERVPCHEQKQSLVLDLPPMSAMLYRCTRRNPVRRPKQESGQKADVPSAKNSRSKKSKKGQ